MVSMPKRATRRPLDEVQAGLKNAMRTFPQGVTVVTTQGEDGPKGITVSSFTSVSLSPPLVLVSLARGSDVHDLFLGAKSFAVNILGDDQRTVSDLFASRAPMRDRFDGVRFHKGLTGSPIIDGARAAIECDTWCVYDGGDHSIILGKAVKASAISSGKPLVYYAQRYTTTEWPEKPSQPSDIG
jgi:flavin reductase (DIM6/NTAB) family NADH-FMN oxidoreductase RutF